LKHIKLAHRWLSPWLMLHLFVGNIPLSMAADVPESTPESFTFSEQAPPTAAAMSEFSKSNSFSKRSAPVSNSGAFGHSVAIDVPPGRLGMTPSIALRYSSSAHRSEGELGAGWSLSTRSITRSARNGFPPVTHDGNRALYDDRISVFEGPDGPMVPAAGPAGAAGTMYAPLREHTPVRYERLNSSPPYSGPAYDVWVEHDPSGIKRYYGQYEGREARVANELGNHSWLLLEEVDARGNNISYGYHSGTISPDLEVPRQQPVLATVRWGGNSSISLPHLFELTTNVTAKTGSLDMLNGHVRNDLRVDSIEVRGPPVTGNGTVLYWRYSLKYIPSEDTGQQLLEQVIRFAPLQPGGVPAQTQSWSFGYSSNAGVVRWDSSGSDFPSSMKGVYVDFYANTSVAAEAASTVDERWYARSNPSDSRSATKFMDYDGNGTLDAIYHPAGIARSDSPINFAQSYLQTGSASWQSLSSGPTTELYNRYISDFVDLDRDSDQDAVIFPSTTLNACDPFAAQPADGHLPEKGLDGFCTKVANSCCMGGLSCDDVREPRFDCLAGRCPDAEGYETVVYPADSIAQIPTNEPLSIDSISIDPSENTSLTWALSVSGAGMCGFGPGLCHAYYMQHPFEHCRTPSDTCDKGDASCALFCGTASPPDPLAFRWR
jgi:hypothetical protein